MKRFISIAVVTIFTVTAFDAIAENLSQVYQNALANDPTFKKAWADWLSAKENLPLAMTGNGAPGSGLFPNLSLSGTFGKTYQPYDQGLNLPKVTSQSTVYSVTLTQPLFNLATWESIRSANYVVKAATAQYFAATQDLISRTAIAYFEVLRASEQLNLTLAQKKELYNEYKNTKSKFDVGLIAITSVYDAQAKYDQTAAQEIKDRNNLQNMLENLRAITGQRYSSLSALKAKIPMGVPKPQKMDDWVAISEKQNYLLQADLNSMLAARQNIKTAAAGMAPTLNLVGSYTNTQINSTPVQQNVANPQETQVGLNLTFPVIRGGYDIVSTKKSRYQYLSSSEQLEIDHRQVVNKTEQAFLEVESGISQIAADKQAIASAQKQLLATQQGYNVGTETMVDVLNSVTAVTTAKQQYADDRYNYIESIITLKQQAGTLSLEDINYIQSWLDTKVVKFPEME